MSHPERPGRPQPRAGHPRPAHLRPGLVGLVALGGACGTLMRYRVAEVVGTHDGWPTATLLVNVVGSFLLGLLLEALLRRGEESARGRLVRLALGTGVLGGLTTFSSLAIEVERLLADGAAALALGYAATSVTLGLLACGLGVVIGTRWPTRPARAAGAAAATRAPVAGPTS